MDYQKTFFLGQITLSSKFNFTTKTMETKRKNSCAIKNSNRHNLIKFKFKNFFDNLMHTNSMKKLEIHFTQDIEN